MRVDFPLLDYLTDKDMWVVSESDASNCHPLTLSILPQLIELTMPKRKQKYTRRNIGKEEIPASPTSQGETITSAATGTVVPPRHLYADPVFTRIETIYSDGRRTVEERNIPFNLNP